MIELNVPKTIIALTTWRGAMPECQESLRAVLEGPEGRFAQFDVKGVPYLDLARNIALTKAAEIFRQLPEYKVVVLLDDDIVFQPDQLHKLAFYAETYQRPVSGLYSLSSGEPSAHFVGTENRFANAPPWTNTSWLTGLGFFAIPKASLSALAEVSEEVAMNGSGDMTITSYTTCGPRPNRTLPVDTAITDRLWYGEDTCLCERFGDLHGEKGIILAPIGVGHIKPQILTPNPASLEKVALGRPFDDSSRDRVAGGKPFE